jgi:hypothetical protein
MVWLTRIGLWVGVGEVIRVGPVVFVFVRVIKTVGVRALIGVLVKAPPVAWRRPDWEVENGPVMETLKVGEGVISTWEGSLRGSGPIPV